MLGTDARGQVVTALVTEQPELIPAENVRRSLRRPNADYIHMGLHIGDIIDFKSSPATATVAGRRVIEYDGEIISLTAATRLLLPTVKFGNAYELWRYRGEDLMAMFDRAYPRPDPS